MSQVKESEEKFSPKMILMNEDEEAEEVRVPIDPIFNRHE